MKNVQFITLLLLAAVSIGPNFFEPNSRNLASEDCINCDDASYIYSRDIEESVEGLSRPLPVIADSGQLFSHLKDKYYCGESDYGLSTKSKGRLSKDQVYFIQNDPMYSEVEDAEFIFAMNLPEKGKLRSSKTTKPFIGKTFKNDLLMVEEVFRGKDIVGYNVTISYCSVISEKDKDLIHDDRELSELAFGGISLDSENTCGLFNDIDSASVTAVSKKNGFFGKNLPFESVFSAIDCDL